MTCSHTPPTRNSWRFVVLVKPRGPHQFTTCLGSVQACHTSSRGAWMTRDMTISRSEVFSAVGFITGMDGRIVVACSTNDGARGGQVFGQAVEILLVGREDKGPDAPGLGRVVED